MTRPAGLLVNFGWRDDVWTDPPAWTDEASNLISLNIKRGRSQELSNYDAGTLKAEFDNRDRRYDPKRQASPLTQTYLSLPGTSGNYAWTRDSVPLSVTGDLDIRAYVAPADWTPGTPCALVAKYGAAGHRSWGLYLQTASTLPQLVFQYTTDGTTALSSVSTASAMPSFLDGSAHWVRATMDVNNGAGGRDVNFYWSEDGVNWTKIGSTITTAGTITMFDSDARVEIGSDTTGTGSLWAGKVYAAAIFSDLTGTTVVANPDFSFGRGAACALFSDTTAAANDWTVAGTAAVTYVSTCLLPRRQVQIMVDDDTATSRSLFRGHILPRAGIEQNYERGGLAETTIEAVDPMAMIASVTLMPLGVSYQQQVLADRPVLYYRMNEANGRLLVRDYSSYRVDGTIVGSPVWQQPGGIVGDNDKSIAFGDGTTALAHLDVPAAAWAITTVSSWTIEAWVYLTKAAECVLLYATDGTHYVRLRARNSGDSNCTLDVDGTSVDGAALLQNSWTHLVARCNAGALMIFANGQPIAPQNLTPSSYGGGAFTTIRIGGDTTHASQYFGRIDEVAIYGRALSDGQIDNHYGAASIGEPQYDGDLPGTRAHRILEIAGVPQTLRSVDTGVTILQPTTWDNNALDELQLTCDSEGGAVFAGGDGKIQFERRHAVLLDADKTAVQATFIDDGTDTSFAHVEYTYADAIYNRVDVTALGFTTAEAVDSSSITFNGESGLKADGLLMAIRPEAEARADWILKQFASVTNSPAKIVIFPLRDAKSLHAATTLELRQRVHVTFNPPGGGTALSADCFIDGIEHQINIRPLSWVCTFIVSSAERFGFTDATQYLKLDDATYGKLDTARLSF